MTEPAIIESAAALVVFVLLWFLAWGYRPAVGLAEALVVVESLLAWETFGAPAAIGVFVISAFAAYLIYQRRLQAEAKLMEERRAAGIGIDPPLGTVTHVSGGGWRGGAALDVFRVPSGLALAPQRPGSPVKTVPYNVVNRISVRGPVAGTGESTLIVFEVVPQAFGTEICLAYDGNSHKANDFRTQLTTVLVQARQTALVQASQTAP